MLISKQYEREIDRDIQWERTKKLIQVFVMGAIGSFMVLLMIFVAFAQFFLSSIEGTLTDQFNLAFIILGMSFISLISSIIVSGLVIDTVRRRSIVWASFFSFICTETLIAVVSLVAIFFTYPHVFNGIEGIEYLLVIPVCIVYFVVYLINYIAFFALIVISYFFFFCIFLNKLYVEREVKKKNARSKRER